MRNVVKLSLALLAAILAFGFTSSALATPVVDQYTEQLPTPGGPQPEDQNNPGNPVGGPGNGSNGSGFTSSGETPSGGDTPTGSDASTDPGNKSGGKDQSDTADKADGVEESDDTSAAVATSGGDDGDGMGWVFPVALVLIATVIAGIAIVRRNRGNLAT